MVQEKSVTLTQSVKVGLIHSLSGTMAISEGPLVEVELMAIDEINKTGGILGYQIEPVTMDGASVPETFAQKAQELLSSGVQFLFGCWTSASRKAVKPIVEDAEGLLWYPVQYEGLEQSEHIIYTGACPVQQIVPAVEWVLAHIGPRIFLVGSDYVFPRTANNLVRSQVENRRGSIVGELYVPQGGMDFASIIEEIQRQKPDAVFSTVFGESNLAFYRQYHAAGIDAQSIPIMAVCISETELQSIAGVAAGHYACRNYFQSLNRPENQRFVANYKKRCGEAGVCSAPMATAYAQIYLWKRVVEAAGSLDVAKVRSHVVGCEFTGPAGPIVIQLNHHTSMSAYIGRATPDGQFEIVGSTAAIRPLAWLGVEDSKLAYKAAVKEAMAAYPEVQNALVELAASEGRFRRIAENNLDNIFEIGLDGTIRYDSPASERIFGYKPEEMTGRSAEFLFSDSELPKLYDSLAVIANGKNVERLETEMLRKDGSQISVEINASPIMREERIVGALGILRDVTERKQVEKALRQSEGRFREAMEATSDGLWDWNVETGDVYYSPAYYQMLGYEPRELPGLAQTWMELIHPDDRDQALRSNQDCVENRISNFAIEFRMRTKSGEWKWILGRGRASARDANGRALRMVGTQSDITERKLAEDALHESEERYRDLFENSTDLIQAVNDDGRFEYVNKEWLKALGYTREETKQLTLMDILRKDQVQHCMELFVTVRSGEVLDRVETVFVSKDGREIIVEGNVNGQFKNGQFVATRAIFRNITERKKVENALKESEERYKAIFEGASDGFLAADVKTNKFVFANPKMCEITGYSLKELLELNLNDIHPKKDLPFVIDQFTKQAQGTLDVAREIPVLRKDKTVLYCDISAKLIEIEGRKCLAGIFRDITERRQVERLKDQFVSTVSHELRTPLTAIRASIGLLASGASGTLPEKGQRMLEIAVTNTDRLVRLINDILDSERLASGKTPMEKKQCSAAQLVTQAADVMKPMADKAGISLSVESQDAVLWADPDRIAQALTNLIGNAIKFSPKGGRIWVTAEPKEYQMLFKVRDEGRGIPPDKLGLLFERFQQVDASDAREKGGTGLGLSISKSIVEQHSGRIWAESTIGKGSTFFFTLPLPQETEVPVQPEAMTEAQSARKVLIIEDDPDLANILATMLQRHDIQPYLALTGEKGITLSKQIHPDMVVLDLGLPDMDGSAVVQALREDNTLRLVPLVVYTVRELDKQQRENLRLGETLFFTKSRIPPDQFEEKVVQFMNRILENRGKTNVS